MRDYNLFLWWVTFWIIMICSIDLAGQNAHKSLRNGDMLYDFGKFDQAEIEYRKAELANSSLKSSYNMGNTLMNQERYEEAAKKFQDALGKASNDDEKAKIYYNQGNALFKNKKFKESVDSYKNSLKFKSSDQTTKENLAIALSELKKQIQQQKQDQKKEDKKDQEKEKKDDQEKNDPNQNNKDNQNQDQKKQEDGKDENRKMSKEDARKLLEIMDNEEKKVQQKLRRMDGGKKPKKDW